MPVVLALVSSVLWGSADFLGGAVTRRRRPLAVVGWSQAAALVAVAGWVLVTRAWHDPSGWLAPGLAVGLVGPLGLCAFYAALSTGRMSVVAPVAALGVAVPVLVGLVRGDAPTAVQVTGMVLAVCGAVLAGGPELRAGAGGRPLALAALAAVCFGCAQWGIAAGSRASPAMTLLAMRVVTVCLVGAVALALRDGGDLVVADAPQVAAVGLLDLSGNAAFAAASARGALSIVAVLGSLYPAVTVVLARLLHGERPSRVQDVGIGGALLGVVLIAAGGGA